MQVSSISNTNFGVKFTNSFKKAINNTRNYYYYESSFDKKIANEYTMYENYLGAIKVYNPNYKLNVKKDGSIALSTPKEQIVGQVINNKINFETLKHIHDIVLNSEE